MNKGNVLSTDNTWTGKNRYCEYLPKSEIKPNQCDDLVNKKYVDKKTNFTLDFNIINKKDVDTNGNLLVPDNIYSIYVKNFISKRPDYIYTTFNQEIKDTRHEMMTTPSIRTIIFDKLGNLYIGGSFNQIGGVEFNNIAMWDNF